AIYESPKTLFVAGFLGTPPVNLWRAQTKGGAAQLGDGIEVTAPRGFDLPAEVVLAVRPEHVVVRAEDEPAPKERVSFLADVTATEPLGAETVVHCDGPKSDDGRVTLRAKVPGFFDPSLCDRVRIIVDHDKIGWFDAKSEARIGGEG
ncbi:MAG: TOBE domain-containing protein, partial [Polyangiaceae bacterium]|nr:TOBE domain-containing protein [Polyangiaceae bacterium]